MKMRTYNHMIAIITVIANIMALIAVITGCHTTFGIVAASISLAVGLGMYLRGIIGTAALKMIEKSELIDIAILQKRDQDVVDGIAKWIRNNDRKFHGSRIVNIADAVDEDGTPMGYWLLLVGTEQSYKKIKAECNHATVLNYWPLNLDKWADDILKEHTDIDDDSPIYDLLSTGDMVLRKE